MSWQHGALQVGLMFVLGAALFALLKWISLPADERTRPTMARFRTMPVGRLAALGLIGGVLILIGAL